MLHDNLNKLADAAERARIADKPGLEADIRDVFNRGGFRYLELTLGKKMQFHVNLSTQDALFDYRGMPAAVRASMDAALDAFDAFQEGRTVDTTARAIGSGEAAE